MLLVMLTVAEDADEKDTAGDTDLEIDLEELTLFVSEGVTVVSGLSERVREILREDDFVTELLVLGDRLMDCVKEIDADSEEEPR